MKNVIVALCGHPTSGKTEVQKILAKTWGIEPVDDGYCLRDFAMRHMGALREHVYSQDGKASLAYMNDEPVLDARTGEHMQWRHVLGRIGWQFEELFGQDFIPATAVAGLKSGKAYSFGSVRRQQGFFYKKRGGLVVGVRAPWAGPSGNDFDAFDEGAVDIWINNDRKDLAELQEKVRSLLSPILHPKLGAMRGDFEVVTG